MKSNYDLKLAQEICAQMGLKWDKTASSVSVHGKQINDIDLNELFHEDLFLSSLYSERSQDVLLKYKNSYYDKADKYLDAA